MIDSKPSKLVGTFIKQRRQTLGLSQRALGQMLIPPVTTQFISNLERAVTPLPLNHVPTLAKVLQVGEGELGSLLEQEYASKLSHRLGTTALGAEQRSLAIESSDYEAMKFVYDAYRTADKRTKQSFLTVCETILGTSGALKASASSATNSSTPVPVPATPSD